MFLRFSGSVLEGTGEGWGKWGGGQGLGGTGVSSPTPFCDSEIMLHGALGTGAGRGGSGVVAIPGKPGAESLRYTFSNRKAENPVGVLVGI